MKEVYFGCAIRAGREDQPFYSGIVNIIGQGAVVLSEIFGDSDLMSSQHQELTEDQIYLKDMHWLTRAAGAIFEVTVPSLGVGYEIRAAEDMKKPVLALYRPKVDKRLSAMIAGNPAIEVVEYSVVEELEKPVKEFLAQIP